jgi:ribosomal protein S10
MKEKVENVHSSSIDPNTCITIKSTNLKNLEKKCHQMRKAYEMHQNQIKGLT